MTAYEKVMESRQELVNRLLSCMEQGQLPWKKEWDGSMLSYNPVTGKHYRGGNWLKLMMAAVEAEYRDPRWMTYKQAQQAGCQVKKGAKGVVLEKWLFEKTVEVEQPDGSMKKEQVELTHPSVMYFIVFNGSEIEGLPSVAERPDIPGNEMADRLIGISECPVIEAAQWKACYMPGKDQILMPSRQMFSSMDAFCVTLLHEMGHSTGAAGRLNRPLSGEFGSPEYAREELRAELASTFLGAELGINGENVFQNHAAYLKSWIGALKENPNELFRAAADAQLMTDRILDRYYKVYEKPELVQMDIPEKSASKITQKTKKQHRL